MPNHSHRGPPRRLPGFDYSDPAQVFFVTTCARQHTPPFVDARLAAVVVDALTWLRSHRGVRLYAYCLMPDHLHLLLQRGTASGSLGTVLRSVKSFTTRASWDLGYQGQLWQARFSDHVMRTHEDGRRMAQYILDNPVRKGLVREAERYAWSGTPDRLE